MRHEPELIGISAPSHAIKEEIDRAAEPDVHVLITGESGVGKEVVARLIHQHSRRRPRPFITVNCSLPDSLLAASLFGHASGGSTAAYRDTRGWIEQADGGTLFMDDIGQLSPQMQAMLMRFLENDEVQRIGSDRASTPVDVRVITATSGQLLASNQTRRFRADLFYRLNIIHIEIPPLRERREDVPVLLAHFLQQFSESHHVARPRLSDEAAARLMSADWPGNVRQLRTVAELLVVQRADVINTADLPAEVLLRGSAIRASAHIQKQILPLVSEI